MRLEADDAVGDVDALASSWRAQVMFGSSSKRAFSSTSTATCVCSSRASESVSTIGELEPTR